MMAAYPASIAILVTATYLPLTGRRITRAANQVPYGTIGADSPLREFKFKHVPTDATDTQLLLDHHRDNADAEFDFTWPGDEVTRSVIYGADPVCEEHDGMVVQVSQYLLAVSADPVVKAKATTTAYAASLIVSGAPGRLYSIKGHNSGAAQFVQIHDAATLPADASIPAVVEWVAADSPIALSWPDGRVFDNGIVICNSSTGPTKTIGAADLWIDAQYRTG